MNYFRCLVEPARRKKIDPKVPSTEREQWDQLLVEVEVARAWAILEVDFD